MQFKTIALAAALATLTVPAFARPPHGDFGPGPDGERGPRMSFVERNAEALELSEDQIDAIGALEGDLKSEMKELHETMRGLRDDLDGLNPADPTDDKALDAHHEQMRALHLQQRDARRGFRDAVYQLLDDGQRALAIERAGEAFEQRRERREDRREERRDRRGKRGDGRYDRD